MADQTYNDERRRGQSPNQGTRSPGNQENDWSRDDWEGGIGQDNISDQDRAGSGSGRGSQANWQQRGSGAQGYGQQSGQQGSSNQPGTGRTDWGRGGQRGAYGPQGGVGQQGGTGQQSGFGQTDWGSGGGQGRERSSQRQGNHGMTGQSETQGGYGETDWGGGMDGEQESQGGTGHEGWDPNAGKGFGRETDWGNQGNRFGSQGYGGRGMSGSQSGSGQQQAGSQYGNYGQTDRGSQGSSWMQGPHTGKGPQGYKRSDERIKEDISERLMQHGHLDASGITVQVQDGEVTLTGTVPDRQTKRLAEDVAEQCSGVSDVQNQLRVQKDNGGNQQSGLGSGSKGETTPTQTPTSQKAKGT